MNAVVGLLPVLGDVLGEWPTSVPSYPLGGVRFGAPIIRPRSIVAVGANTKSHLAEASIHTGGHQAKRPLLITKAASALCGPHDPILRPADTPPTRLRDRACRRHRQGDITARDIQTGEDEEADFYGQHFRSNTHGAMAGQH